MKETDCFLLAVRLGDLLLFNKVLNKHAVHVFGPDETLTLIVRLRQNVIKTALRQISTAYSCISIKDICKKLLLNSDQEAEYLVAKVSLNYFHISKIFPANLELLWTSVRGGYCHY